MSHKQFASKRISPGWVLTAAVLGLLFVTAQSSRAQVDTTLYSFAGPPDGLSPAASLGFDKQGNLYGTTQQGGDTVIIDYNHFCTNGCGSVFKVTSTGTKTTLYSFTGQPDGAMPKAAVVIDERGNLYGTTYYGGTYNNGTVFEVTATGEAKVLYSFTGGADGAFPMGSLILDKKGNLYGTAGAGGTCSYAGGCGTVFKVTPAGSETVVYNFTGTDGAYPWAGLVFDEQGNLYGTTGMGGTYRYGTVFEVTREGIGRVLYSFTGGPDGGYPASVLVLDKNGNLYGTTVNGGAYGWGTVFQISPLGTEKVLYSFTGGPDCALPLAGLILDKNGNLYGTTVNGGAYGYGTVFEVTGKGIEKALYSFAGPPDGSFPAASLLFDKQGNLYGTTVQGGVNSVYGYGGTVFKLTP